jgi:hypothetical protein
MSSRYLILLLAILFSVYASCLATLDLNEPPPPDEVPIEFAAPATTTSQGGEQQQPVKPAPVRRVPSKRQQTKKTTRITRKQFEMFKLVRDTIADCFKILAICDDVNFNIDNIQLSLSESWSEQILAMKKLQTVSNVIKKGEEQERYERIMKNCNEITRKLTQKVSHDWKPEHELSGGMYVYDIEGINRESQEPTQPERYSDTAYANTETNPSVVLGQIDTANVKRNNQPTLYQFFW